MAKTLEEDRKKKVLVVCQHFWPENFRLNDMCDYLIENGYEVDVLCGTPNYPLGKFYDGYGLFKKRRETHNKVHIERVWEIPRGSNSNWRVFLNYISFPFFSLFHLPALLTRKYDRIFLYQLSPVLMSVTGILLGKIKHIETTMYILDLWPQNLFSVLKIKSKFWREVATRVSYWHYRNVDKVMALSERMRQEIQKIVDLPDSKIAVFPQSCEKLYENDIQDANLRKRFSGTFNIIYAGNISPAQDFETVIAAAKIIKKAGIGDIRWIIVGDGMSRKTVEKKVIQSGLSNDFVFEGMKKMTDIPRYNTLADALLGTLVTSDLLEATIPAKVMSYFAAGKPIILAMDGEVQTLVNEIGCGFATETGNANALADSIIKLHGMSPNLRKKMGDMGRAYYFANFERNIMLKKVTDFIFDNKIGMS